jgi:hypothetical protein
LWRNVPEQNNMTEKLVLKPINAAVKDGDVPSRSWVYRELKANRIAAKKVGARTYLVMQTIEACKTALPDYVPMSRRSAT